MDERLLQLVAVALAVVAATSVAGAVLLVRSLRRRLRRIGEVAAAIASGDLARRVPVGVRHDEFNRLGRAVNAMLDRITSLVENLRQVSTDVAHDLRTPLARIRAGLESVADEDDPARLRSAIVKAISEGDDLLALFGAILRIAEVERGGAAVVTAPVDLAEVAAYMTEAYAPAVADGGRTLRLDAPLPVHVRADRALLFQALANLIDNAQLHTPPGTTIAVGAGRRDEAAVLCVADDGPGVPMGDREHVTRRFARLERSRTTPGHGLGLNMVSAIARAHGGSFELGDAAPGLLAEIVLPKAA